MLKYFLNSLLCILFYVTALSQQQRPAEICSGTPAAGRAVSNRPIACPTDSVRLTVINASLQEGLIYQWQLSADSLTWTDIPGATSAACTTLQDSTRLYRRITSCAGNEAISTPVKVGKSPCYCKPPASNCSNGVYIARVSFGTLMNSSGCSPNGYADFSDSIAPAAVQPQPYPIGVGVTAGPVGGSGQLDISMWIDLNRNGIFEMSEYRNIGSVSGGGGRYSAITLPLNSPGLTRIRVRIVPSFPLSAGEACSTIGSGETEDYLINILPYNYCSGTPLQDTAYPNVANTCDYHDSVYLHTTPQNAGYQNFTYQWQKSTNGIDWTNSFSTDTDGFDYVTSTTYFRRRISCGDSSNYSIPCKVTYLCYCIPDPSICSTGVAINKVILNGVEYPSGCGYPGYQNLSRGTETSHVDTIFAGTDLPISVQAACAGTSPQHVGVWIDLDLDGEFEPDEYIYLGTACNSTVTGHISIPAHASGQPKIRVRITTDSNFTAASSCTTLTYGETEDYRINIVPAPGACAVNTWTGLAGNTLWEDTANWSCSHVPGPEDAVAINSGTVTINSDVTVYSLSLGAAATFTVTPPYHFVILH